MSLPRLNKNEKVIKKTGMHWKNYLLPTATLIVCELLLLWRLENKTRSLLPILTGISIDIPVEIMKMLVVVEIFCLVIMIFGAMKRICEVAFTVYTLTTERIIINSGVFNVRENEMNLRSCWNIEMTQTLYERIFNTGDLLLCSAAASFYLDDVRRVREFKETINDLIVNRQ